MYLAARQVADSGLRRVPLHQAGRLLARKGRCRVLVIGGGTLLGRPEWLTRAVEAQRTLRPERTVVIGTGVEPLSFGESRGTTDAETAAATGAFLRSCDYVGVRGPRSKEELEREGVQAEIVGDPALCLQRLSGGRGGAQRTVAVNLAAVRDGLESAKGQTEREIVRCASQLRSQDWRVVFFAMEKADERLARGLVGGQFVVLPWRNDVPRLIKLLSSVDAVISERLHGGILAAACGTPFLQVGYKPKVYDFVESIGAEALVRSPRDLDGEEAASAIADGVEGGLDREICDGVSRVSSQYRRALLDNLALQT